MSNGVSFVVPVHNGAAWIRETIAAIAAQADGRPMEIVVVEDGSRDGSAEVLRGIAAETPLQIVAGGGRGAAAAINTGIRAARFPIVCQVDQDVAIGAGWMARLAAELDDPGVAAAQGYYATDPDATLCARAMSLDLEQRYAAIDGADTGHVCTGNAAYRASALHQVGLFDETLGYGYDNDMSYRLRAAGYGLRLCREARSVHRWREGFAGYLGQQYGFGYGRIDVVAKHPRRAGGDSVSPAAMMAHPLLMALALAALVPFPRASLAIVAALALERLVAGIAAARRFRDPAALLFPVLHLARDLAWVAAIAAWLGRRATGVRPRPSHSMQPRSGTPAAEEMVRLKSDATYEGGLDATYKRGADATNEGRSDATYDGRSDATYEATSGAALARRYRVLTVIPAHNEVINLAAVVAELRASRPGLDILIVDDGSTDQTAWLADRLDVRWLRFQERIGIGSAMRAGLRYAARQGYDIVVRIDGDGQHRAGDIERLLVPVVHGRADVALGSRFTGDAERRFSQRALGACLSAITGHAVTDPTSGFWVLGPRAIRLLAEHHPTGYPEPELRLFLSHNALSVVEVPVTARARLRGRTSLTPIRLLAAGARVLLAMVVVPLRRRVRGLAGD